MLKIIKGKTDRDKQAEEEAKKKCPELMCVHVETIGGEATGAASAGDEPHDRSSSKVSDGRTPAARAMPRIQ
jgi:hypothetical protein